MTPQLKIWASNKATSKNLTSKSMTLPISKLLQASLMVCALTLAPGCPGDAPAPTPTPTPTNSTPPAPKKPEPTGTETTCGDKICAPEKELLSCPKDCVEQWTPKMDFVTVWNSGKDGSLSILTGEGEFLYQVDWDNDGVFDQKGITGPTSHKYPKAGTYTVRIRGTFPHMCSTLDDSCARSKPIPKQHLLEVKQWGSIQWRSMARMFSKQVKLVALPTSAPDLSQVQDMSHMFNTVYDFNQPLGTWDTSNVTTMQAMFNDAAMFNQDLSTWDTSNVTNMSQMFLGTEEFDQDISGWNTSNVTNMSEMFSGNWKFNQPINTWDTSHVTDMSSMFSGTQKFNQPLGKWNTSNVTSMKRMFNGTRVFNQKIGGWDTANVTDMSGMFFHAIGFNQPLETWNTSKVTSMKRMFYRAEKFNRPLAKWNTSKVTTMTQMFDMTEKFNQPLGKWNTSKVTDMSDMFYEAYAFNQSLGDWNLSNIKPSKMPPMMANQLRGSMKQPGGNSLMGFFSALKMTTAHYDATLRGWAANKATPKGLTLTTDLHYCKSNGARKKLIKQLGWTIKDKGTKCP